MTSLCFFVQLPDRTSILAKGVFLVLMIGKSLLLNHSPSEWFSLYKKQDGIYSSVLFFVGSADLCLYGAGLLFHVLCRPTAAHMLPALANAIRAAILRLMGGRKRHSADCASRVALSPSLGPWKAVLQIPSTAAIYDILSGYSSLYSDFCAQ